MPVWQDEKTKRWRFQGCISINGRKHRPCGSAPPNDNTKKGAKEAEREALNAIKNPPPKTVAEGKDVPTFKEWSEVYMELRTLKQSENERDSKRQKLKSKLVPRFGHMRLDYINQGEIDNFIKSLTAEEPKLAPSTMNNYLTCLSTILRYGHKRGQFHVMPDIPLFDIEDQPFGVYSDDELAVLLGQAQDDVMQTAALLMGFDAGLRAGEIRALHRSHIANGWITVYKSVSKKNLTVTKGKKMRAVPMTARLAAAVNAALAMHDGERVLVRTLDYKRSTRSLGTPWTKAFMVHNQPPKGWHALRHSFCSRLAMQGVPPTQIQKLAGHASLKTTMRYMHTVDKALRDAVSLLETGQQYAPPVVMLAPPPSPAPMPPPAAPAAVQPVHTPAPEVVRVRTRQAGPYKQLPSTQRLPVNGVPYAEYHRQLMRRSRELKRQKAQAENGTGVSGATETPGAQD